MSTEDLTELETQLFKYANEITEEITEDGSGMKMDQGIVRCTVASCDRVGTRNETSY